MKINAEGLKYLRTVAFGSANLSIREAAERIGITPKTLFDLESGKLTKCQFETLCKIADFYQVSLDYLCGRVDNPSLLYSIKVEALLDQSYERYLRMKRPDEIKAGSGYEASYPYNLLDHVGIEDLEGALLTADQCAGLEIALDTLSEREAMAIRLYYGANGAPKTLDKVGEEFGLTRERIRQFIASGVRKLRHPSRAKLIIYGKEAYETLIECKRREAEIATAKAKLAVYARDCKQLEAFNTVIEKVNELRDAFMDIADIPENNEPPESTTIDELELSVRSYNCLKRANISTVQELVDYHREHNIMHIRNLGANSFTEIVDAVHSKCGIDITEVAEVA